MMSDCPKCWDTPCECGHEGYITIWLPAKHGLSVEQLAHLKQVLKADLASRIAEIKADRRWV